MKRKFSLLLTIVIILTMQFRAFASSKPQIGAQSAILIDYSTGQILYDKNMNNRYGPASTTKIMTALITLEKCKLTDKVTVGKNPPYEDGSKIYLLEGETLTVEQLLYAMLLESANDAALALAEHIGGSKAGFAEIMNNKARELGCKNTNFTNPNGLYDAKHYTSAYDLALITMEAMKNPIFNKMISTVSYKITPTNKQKQTRYLHNHNKLLYSPRYKYVGADGVKTGYTIKTRHTFVGSASRGGRRLVSVILMDQQQAYDDVKKLFDYGFSNYTSRKIVSRGDNISSIGITNSNIKIPVYAEKDVFLSVPVDKKEPFDVKKDIVLNQSLTSLHVGQVVGNMYISTNNGFKTSVPLICNQNYTSMVYNLESQSKGIYKKILNKKFILIPIVSVSLVIAGIYMIKIRKRSRFY